jgi:phosphatidylinositol glycan class B
MPTKDKHKNEDEMDDFSHLTFKDYQAEIDMRRYAVFWDSLDLESWVNIFKLFAVRLAVTMVLVNEMRHPDEIYQNKEVAYKLIYGQSPDRLHGVQTLLTWEWWEGFNLRTHVYPLWLALPGFALKQAGLDTNFLLINSFYVMHCIIWVFADYYSFLFVRQLIDKKTAIATIIFSVSSEYINNYVLRTSANAIEGNLMMIAFYYLINIQPKIFDKNLTLMTMSITFSFLIRSSSLVGYFPLAILLMYQDPRFIAPIVVAGLSCAIPLVFLSVALDTYLYGFLTFPQWNFVNWNVFKGISKYFGEEAFYHYFDHLNNEFCEIESYGFTCFLLISLRLYSGQIQPCSGNGWLRKIKEATPNAEVLRMPFMLIFFASNLSVLSYLAHKEARFLTTIVMMG